MSFPTGTPGRGRGRGRGGPNLRGPSRGRGGAAGTGSFRGQSGSRGRSGGQFTRGTSGASNRGLNGNSLPTSRRPGASSVAQTRGAWPDRYDKLVKARERERANAIANNIIADPNRPTTLQNAVTPKGTCPDMCSEFERVERVVQKDVWHEETDPNHSAFSTTDREPDESRMVKKFRRSAAGLDEQLPSDLRPPSVLKRTCDFLFDEIIGNAPELGKVHHFVWDRTRAIRNDFSIQQVSETEDLRYAVECFERIARFHILSLHQLAVRETVSYNYDWQQDHEQLDRTLVSLMQLYEDSRGKIALPNEAEFRAYLVVFQLKDPDLEDRVQTWPKDIIRDPRVRKAMTLYAAAGNTSELQGPLKPPAVQVIAQQDWQRFWNLIASTRTSYLIACVAEVSFNSIRRMALLGLLRSGSQKASGDFTINEVSNILAFDYVEEAEDFCNKFNVTFADGSDGQRMVDFSAIRGRQFLPEPSPALQKQYKSEMVEEKRFGRTLSAVINGLNVKQAQEAGLINEDELTQDHEMDEAQVNEAGATDEQDAQHEDSLFMPEDTKSDPAPGLLAPSAQSSAPFNFHKEPKSIFDAPTEPPKPSPFSFGAPSGPTPSPSNASPFAPPKTEAAPAKPAFNFLSNTAGSQSTSPKASPPPTFPSFAKPPEQQSTGASTLFPSAASAEPKESSSTLFSGFKPPTSTPSANDSTQSKPSPFSRFQLGGTSQSGPSTTEEPAKSLFSQPAKAVPTYKSPFLEEGSDASAENTPRHSTTLLSKDTQSTPVTGNFDPSTIAKPTPSFNFAQPQSAPQPAPSQSPKHVKFETPTTTSLNATSNPPFSFAQPAQPKDQMPPAQTAQTAKPVKQPGALNFGPAPDSASQRRGSASDQFKPARPSPLNQSFTSAADTEHPSQAAPTPSSAPTSAKELFPGKQSATTQSKPAPVSKAAPGPDFNSIIGAIAKDITLTSVSGLLDQYVDFVAGRVITDAQEKVFLEHVNAEADAFRTRVLSLRFGRRWRDICRHKRFARQGRERRERTRRRLAQSKKEASETASLAGSVSWLGGSEVGSVQESVRGGRQSRQEEVDRMFQQSVSSGRWAKKAQEADQAKGGSKRPTSAHGMGPPQTNGHKRLKSTSHVDDSGRISKSSSTHGALRRSSFMDSLPNAPPRSTTKTNYFRLKAAGALIRPIDSSLQNTRKRQYSEMSGSPPVGSPQSAAGLNKSLQASPQDLSQSLVREGSFVSSKSLKAAEDDDVLLARARSLRENLKNDTSFFKSENARAEDLKKSTGSQGSYESPSLERARLEARWRASQSTSNVGTPSADVPAYRLRESKFVPRENYGKVFERSSKMRQSMTADTSEVEKATPAVAVSTAPGSQLKPPPRAMPSNAGKDFGSSGLQGANVNGTFASVAPTQWSSATPSQFPAFGSNNSGLSPSNNSAQAFGSAGLNSKAAKQNTTFDLQNGSANLTQHYNSPFDSSTVAPSSFARAPQQPVSFQQAFGETPDTHDHTIPPQQIPQSLSASFGQPDMPSFQQDSYLSTQSGPSQMPHGFYDDGFTPNVNQESLRGNGLSADFIDDEAEEADVFNAPGLATANPYAMLSNGNADEDEEEQDEQYDEDEDQDDQWDDDQYAQGRSYQQPNTYPTSYPVDEYDETEEDADIEDEDEEGYDDDELEEGDTEESAEDDEDDWMLHGRSMEPPKPAVAAASCTNTALVGKGQNETEAIELSD